MVLVNTSQEAERNAIPRGMRILLASGKYGNTIPMVFVTSPDASQGIAGASYASLSADARRARRDLQQAIDEAGPMMAGAAQVPTEEPAQEPDEAGSPEPSASEPEPRLLAGQQAWTNAEGVTIRAAVAGIDGDTVRFVMPNGSIANYPIANLSEESRERLAKFAEPE